MLIRKNPKSGNGWNNADIDTLFCLWNRGHVRGRVWDGDIPSKESRDHLVNGGYVARGDGHQWLTAKGRKAFLTSPLIEESAALRHVLLGYSPFVRNKRHIN